MVVENGFRLVGLSCRLSFVWIVLELASFSTRCVWYAFVVSLWHTSQCRMCAYHVTHAKHVKHVKHVKHAIEECRS
jgi:hypothetical protein